VSAAPSVSAGSTTGDRGEDVLAHISFVHGIANKPPQDKLLDQWRVALADDDGFDLDEYGVTSTMVYWADMLYAEPAAAGAGHESTGLELEQGLDADDADLTWLTDLARSVGFESVSATPDGAQDPMQPELEAIPLPGWLKRRLMRVFLRDVHHYLFDASFSPRPGETFRIRKDIRARVLTALLDGAKRPGPHVVVGHSLGSVIAYDSLTAIDDAPVVDAILTLGSPLGISEVQDGLTPPWTRKDGWPAQRLGSGRWGNFYDPLDPVCGGFDRLLAPDYLAGGVERVADARVDNTGSWRHSIAKYLGQREVRDWLKEATV
jgi:Alpha/beta hydrolase family